MKEEERKTPELRFPGFTDNWEQRKLSELINEYKETVDSDCTLPILTSSKTEGVVLQEEHFGRKQLHDIAGYNILPRGYCTYRNRSDGVDFTFNINKCCDKGIISKFYPVFCGNNSNITFISMVLNYSDEVIHEIGYTCVGTGQKVLSFTDLQKMKIRVPSLAEQDMISEFFSTLDDLITLHQRKLEQMQEYKRGMLQKLFPKKGEKVPEVRFPGFTEDWEQCKLGECFDERSERRVDQEQELLSVTISGGVIRQADSDKRNIASADTSNYKMVYPGDLAYNSMRMWQGAEGVSQFTGIVSPAYTVLRPKEGIISEFFAMMFKQDTMLYTFERNSQGLTSDTWNLKYPALSQIKVVVPSLEEQQTITDFLSKVDNLITLHQRKLEQMKEYKKGLLQKMFV